MYVALLPMTIRKIRTTRVEKTRKSIFFQMTFFRLKKLNWSSQIKFISIFNQKSISENGAFSKSLSIQIMSPSVKLIERRAEKYSPPYSHTASAFK